MGDLIKQRLKLRLDQMDMSASSLEQKAKLSSGAVRNILLGRSKNPTINTLMAIARVLGCTVNDLAEEISPSIPAFDKIKPDKEAFPWQPDLFVKVLHTVDAHLKKRNYRANLDEFLFFAKEIYVYCMQDKNGTLDEKFTHWLIDKNIKIY